MVLVCVDSFARNYFSSFREPARSLMHVPLRSDTDVNLGCPQDIAREEHFGAYLLGKKDWPLVQGIGEQNHWM